MQARHEERMKGKIFIFNNEPFDIQDAGGENGKSKPTRGEATLKKGDRTREKSLAEGKKSDM
jgi:hypothetical protein